MNLSVFSYSTNNIGDDIQSLAVMQMLDELGYSYSFFDRDCHIQHRQNSVGTESFVIANGWYTHNPQPFPDTIYPLLVGVHLAPPLFNGCPEHQAFLDYLKTFEPIGCRDIYTLQELRSRGIQAYLSHCFTLMMKPFRETTASPESRKPLIKPVYHVDLMPEMTVLRENPELKARYDSDDAILLTHYAEEAYRLATAEVVSWRFELARLLLAKYGEAQRVVTTRLHCALPCKAMGVPFEFLYEKPMDNRFTGFEELLGIGPSPMLWSEQRMQTVRKMLTLIVDTSIRMETNVMRYVEEREDPERILFELGQIRAGLVEETSHSA